MEAGVKIDVLGVRFADEVQSVERKLLIPPAQQQAGLKFCVVTLRFTKPSGQPLTLAAADLSAHYWRGDDPQVCGCIGLSHFSAATDDSRPMQLVPIEGFAFVRARTGATTTLATEVYADAIFPFIPADTAQLWVCLGQPISRQPYPCKAPETGKRP
jgi:hypothetical protein